MMLAEISVNWLPILMVVAVVVLGVANAPAMWRWATGSGDERTSIVEKLLALMRVNLKRQFDPDKATEVTIRNGENTWSFEIHPDKGIVRK